MAAKINLFTCDINLRDLVSDKQQVIKNIKRNLHNENSQNFLKLSHCANSHFSQIFIFLVFPQ